MDYAPKTSIIDYLMTGTVIFYVGMSDFSGLANVLKGKRLKGNVN